MREFAVQYRTDANGEWITDELHVSAGRETAENFAVAHRCSSGESNVRVVSRECSEWRPLEG